MFEEELGVKQIPVTNDTGRTVAYGELVYLNGFFGTVAEHAGIEDDAEGYIDISADRLIKTDQFTAGSYTAKQTIYFVAGDSSASGKIKNADESGAIIAGYLIQKETGFVLFKPRPQLG